MDFILNIWRVQGTIDRLRYFLSGVVLLLIKNSLDKFIARVLFNRSWTILNYFVPGTTSIADISEADATFYAALVLAAIPFIWCGVALTLRRLRAAGLPLWMIVFFFVPILNTLFFAVLCLLPSKVSDDNQAAPPEKPWINLDRIIPSGQFGSAFAGVLSTVVLGTAATLLSVQVLGSYGWGLFVGLPFCLGMSSVLIYGYHQERSWRSCFGVSMLAVFIPAAALILFAVEGAICLMMAAPLAIPLSMLGGFVGYTLQKKYHARQQTANWLTGIIIALPAFMGAEHTKATPPPLIRVTSAVEIDAAPERVWNHVVTFSQLPEPTEWLFKLGLAYPIKAEIKGTGVGACRHCIFSTGPFVEPIEVWDEPRLLKFSVTENPAPMQEWTFYSGIHPPHLHNFLVSKGGQFLLTPLAGGRTHLQGTTWYHHSMWPAAYWQLWSDFIIHRIHLRVLDHVKNLAETPQTVGESQR